MQTQTGIGAGAGQPTYPPLFVIKQNAMFLDFAHGKFHNSWALAHNVEGQDKPVVFGSMAAFGGGRNESPEKRRAGCTYWIDSADGEENSFDDYKDFAAAYYAKFPERIEINWAKEAAHKAKGTATK